MENSNITDLASNPTQQFDTWYKLVLEKLGKELTDTCCLSTINLDGYPEGRMVLMREFDENGFVFFTNSTSTKGQSLIKTPKAAMTFYWEPFGWQVRVYGDVERTSKAESDKYFSSRHPQSQIGAWASLQSQSLESRAVFESRIEEYTEKYNGKVIPRPAHWHGFRLKAKQYEFWIARDFRLHDRFIYNQEKDGNWTIVRLYP